MLARRDDRKNRYNKIVRTSQGRITGFVGRRTDILYAYGRRAGVVDMWQRRGRRCGNVRSPHRHPQNASVQYDIFPTLGLVENVMRFMIRNCLG